MSALNTATLQEAADMHLDGRISDRQWRRFRLAWIWGAARFGGEAGRLQERLYARGGMNALERRRVRVLEAARRCAP